MIDKLKKLFAKPKPIKDVVQRELVRAFKERAQELKEHFEESGWPIRPDESQVLLDYFDVDPITITLKELSNNVTFKLIPSKLLNESYFGYTLRDHDTREFAIYDSWEDKIVTFLMTEEWPGDGDRYHWLGLV